MTLLNQVTLSVAYTQLTSLINAAQVRRIDAGMAPHSLTPEERAETEPQNCESGGVYCSSDDYIRGASNMTPEIAGLLIAATVYATLALYIVERP